MNRSMRRPASFRGGVESKVHRVGGRNPVTLNPAAIDVRRLPARADGNYRDAILTAKRRLPKLPR
jgi:hypothetical protein